jgi:hypothetical protein
MRSLILTLILAVTTVLLAPPAAALERREIQILAIASPDAFENARALTGSLRRAVMRSEVWSLAAGEFSLEVLTAALDCPDVPDATCLKKISAEVGAKTFIWGFVKKAGSGEVEASLHLWQGSDSPKETSVRYSANLTDDTDDTLLGLSEKAFFDLVGAPTGTLLIEAGTVSGELQVNGELVGLVKKGKAQVEVKAGKLTVLIEAKGYEKLVGTIVVPPGRSATLRLVPVRLEGEEAVEEEPEPEPAEELPADTTPQGPMGSRKTWGFVSLGAGGAALIVGTVFWVQSFNQSEDPAFAEYVNQTPSNEDPCVRARDQGDSAIVDICDSNLTARTMTYVMLPIGIALGGLGTYLILSDPGDDGAKTARARRPRVLPRVGLAPGAGRFDLQVTF